MGTYLVLYPTLKNSNYILECSLIIRVSLPTCVPMFAYALWSRRGVLFTAWVLLAERDASRKGEKWTHDLPSMLMWQNLEVGVYILGRDWFEVIDVRRWQDGRPWKWGRQVGTEYSKKGGMVYTASQCDRLCVFRVCYYSRAQVEVSWCG